MLTGRATVEGTARWAERARSAGRVAPGHYRRSAGDLTLSSLGVGTYLGAPDAATDRAVEEAVGVSIVSGRVNVVDTAHNYRYQKAERAVGRALARAVAAGRVEREAVFVSTKVGYLAPDGDANEPPSDWLRRHLIEPGVLAEDEIVDGCHALAPRFVEDQVERCRQNLGLETIDLVYLHNAADQQLAAVGPTEFRRRLAAAFAALERLRRDGRVGAYGIASWDAFRVPPGAPGHASLEEIAGLARTAGSPGLAMVQFPFNRAMPEARLLPTQPVGGTVHPLFEAAGALGIACMTSVPLLQGRFAAGRAPVGGLTAAQGALQIARSATASTTALVGQKRVEHVAENLHVAEVAPLAPDEVARLLRA